MPVIKKSAELRNNYGEISAPGKNELYKLIEEGIDNIKNGRTLTEEEIIKNMDNALLRK